MTEFTEREKRLIILVQRLIQQVMNYNDALISINNSFVVFNKKMDEQKITPEEADATRDLFIECGIMKEEKDSDENPVL